jgi:hypothetical protein
MTHQVLLIHEYLAVVADLEPFRSLSDGWSSNAARRVSRLATLTHQHFNFRVDRVQLQYNAGNDHDELTMRVLLEDMLEHVANHGFRGDAGHPCFEQLYAQSKARLVNMGLSEEVASTLMQAVGHAVGSDVDMLIRELEETQSLGRRGLTSSPGITITADAVLLSHRHLTYDARWSVAVESFTLTDPYAFRIAYMRPKEGVQGRCLSLEIAGRTPLRPKSKSPLAENTGFERASDNAHAGGHCTSADGPMDMAALAVAAMTHNANSPGLAGKAQQDDGGGRADSGKLPPTPPPTKRQSRADRRRRSAAGGATGGAPGHRRQLSLEKLLSDLSAAETAKPSNAFTLVYTSEDPKWVWASGNCSAAGLYLLCKGEHPLDRAPTNKNISVHVGELDTTISDVGMASLLARYVTVRDLFQHRTQWLVQKHAFEAHEDNDGVALCSGHVPASAVPGAILWQVDLDDTAVSLVRGCEPVAIVSCKMLSMARSQPAAGAAPTYRVLVATMNLRNVSMNGATHSSALWKSESVQGPMLSVTSTATAVTAPDGGGKSTGGTSDQQSSDFTWAVQARLDGARVTVLKCFWSDLGVFLTDAMYPSVRRALAGRWTSELSFHLPGVDSPVSSEFSGFNNFPESAGGRVPSKRRPGPGSANWIPTPSFNSPAPSGMGSPHPTSFLHVPQTISPDQPLRTAAAAAAAGLRPNSTGASGEQDEVTAVALRRLLSTVVLEMECADISLLVPRNSGSLDVMALTMEKGNLSYSRVSNSWPSPHSNRKSGVGSDGPLRFDVQRGCWLGSALANYGTSLGTEGYATSAEELLQQTPGAHSMGHDMGRLVFNMDWLDLFVARFPDGSDTARQDSSLSTKMSTHSPFSAVTALDEDGDDDIGSAGPSTPGPSASARARPPAHLSTGAQYIGRIAHGEPAVANGDVLWKQLTSIGSVDKLLVVDFNAHGTRVLISDTATNAPVHICDMLMEDMNLIQSLWYDNFHEHTVGGPEEDPHQVSTHNNGGGQCESESHVYGTPEFSEYLASYCEGTEILIVFHSIYLNCLRDSDSLDMQANIFAGAATMGAAGPTPPRYGSRACAVPVSFDVFFKRGTFHAVRGRDVHKAALGLADIELRDSRSPKCAEFPIIFRPQQHTHNERVLGDTDYGYADFSFGLKRLTTRPEHAPVNGLCLTQYKCFLNQWTTTNVGVNRPDVNVDQWKVLHQISDYFMVYHRHAHYGNPSIATWQSTSLDNRTFFGVDYRIFLYYPLTTIMKVPLSLGPPRAPTLAPRFKPLLAYLLTPIMTSSFFLSAGSLGCGVTHTHDREREWRLRTIHHRLPGQSVPPTGCGGVGSRGVQELLPAAPRSWPTT